MGAAVRLMLCVEGVPYHPAKHLLQKDRDDATAHAWFTLAHTLVAVASQTVIGEMPAVPSGTAMLKK